ncbi:MAG: GDP-mannose 4,6-dehydratase [Planctomycetes bacterium]|jgi:GDPmannose 4,6-dehydratase|nr:GDP-mannose 4,6-dehydratase [Planctomycetota bacterium]MBT4029046.1 GDP-mannose 4,6-dehydratase [Planctomycetota bacterium]MBT4560334.1 GDP-mannose 4,6-dehydratase [Planctomycetota bacterium]MBT7012805.1 GDP-mannose 4,6-dehydratase [Planctomycetota bacterium]MBT7318124.1 GDP-mannose 4,6-dehydratase [Planctomycetota bacterium]
MKTAFITGISGQDGSYLAEHLLDLDYRVVAMMRRSATQSVSRFAHIADRIEIVHGDLLDQASLMRLLTDCQPDEIYNLAAQSFVHASFDEPIHTGEVTGLGVMRMLEAVRLCAPKARFYQASSSEMFGKVHEVPQSENTPFHPRSPYGVAKVYGHWATLNYRESYDMYACSGILFNHESPRRGLEFVTRKISDHVAAIVCGEKDGLALGNLDAQRDWGFAGDYIKAMHLMLQQDEPDDYVVATNETHTVREFCEIAFGHVGLDYNDFVSIDPKYYRPAEVELLLGDATKAKEKLGWEPEVNFRGLVEMMVDYDLKRRIDQGATCQRGSLPEALA